MRGVIVIFRISVKKLFYMSFFFFNFQPVLIRGVLFRRGSRIFQ